MRKIFILKILSEKVRNTSRAGVSGQHGMQSRGTACMNPRHRNVASLRLLQRARHHFMGYRIGEQD